MSAERFTEIESITFGDEKTKSVISNVKKSIRRYYETVTNMEATLKAQRFRLEGSEFRKLTERLDSLRHSAHEVLMDSIRIANRYLVQTYGKDIPVGGVYSGDSIHLRVPDRIAIGNWALNIMKEDKCINA